MSLLFGNKRKKWERESEALVARGLAELDSHQWNVGGAKAEDIGAARLKLSGYSIDKAIELLKALPSSDEHLIATIVQKTLESAHINAVDIVNDANKKVDRLESRMTSLRERIKDLEKEIQNHREEIAQHEKDLAETIETRRRLQLALPPVPVVAQEKTQGMEGHVTSLPVAKLA